MRKQTFPMKNWALNFREFFLREVLRLDGRGDALHATECRECPEAEKPGVPEYRCQDCRGADLCFRCIVRWHRYNPLHIIEVR